MEIDLPETALQPPAAAEMAVAFALAGGGIAVSLVVASWIVARARRGLPAVSPRPRPPVSWTGFEVAVAAALFLWLQLLVAATIPAGASLHARLAGGAAAMIAATLATVALLRQRGVEPAALGFGPVRLPEDAALGVAALALILAPLLVMAAGLNRLMPYRHALIDFLAAHRDPLAIGLVVFAAVVAAPIAEEFLFRRVLQGWLERREPEWGRATPIVLSSLAFALAHVGQGLAWVPLFFFGLVAGYLARQTGSIVPGIILHALFNAVSVVLVLGQTAPGTAGGG
jgi:membrane protease YdiL (CAAX protease family)